MASVLGNYLRARESAYFKVEQEAATQQHKDRLVKEGKLPKTGGANSKPHSHTMEESEATYDVLPEVLQAQARVDDPNAAKKKLFDLRTKATQPPATEEELRRYRVSSYALGGAVGHVPRMSLSGRDRYGIAMAAAAGDAAVPQLRQLSPQAIEVAQRSYVAGVRALVYGSLLAFAGLALGGTYVVSHLTTAAEIEGSGGGVRAQAQRSLAPFAAAVKGVVEPWKVWGESWLGPLGTNEGSSNGGGGSSELQTRLKDRFDPKSSPSSVR